MQIAMHIKARVLNAEILERVDTLLDPHKLIRSTDGPARRVMEAEVVIRLAKLTTRAEDVEGSVARAVDAEAKVHELKRLKELQKENAQLKKLAADLSLDKAIFQEALSGNY